MSRVVTPSTPSHGTMSPMVPHDKIAMRAYEKWMKRGCKDGHADQDWVEAEAECIAEQKRSGGSTYAN